MSVNGHAVITVAPEAGCNVCNVVTYGLPKNLEGQVIKECVADTDPSCPAASLACNEVFRPTVPASRIYLLGKSSPGDKCLKHFTNSSGGFVVSEPDGEQKITQNPIVRFPAAQGYLVDPRGNLLCNDGVPILGPNVRFKYLPVTGVLTPRREDCSPCNALGSDFLEGTVDARLFSYVAPESPFPVYLRARNGWYEWAGLFDDGICSTKFPDKVQAGRLLFIDDVQPEDCDCETKEWCIREWCRPVPDGRCSIMVTRQVDNKTQIESVERPTSATNGGTIHFSKDDGCLEFEEELEGLRYVQDGEVKYLPFPDLSSLQDGDCATLEVCRDGADLLFQFKGLSQATVQSNFAFVCRPGFFQVDAANPSEIVGAWSQSFIPNTTKYGVNGTGILVKQNGNYKITLSTGIANNTLNNNSGLVDFQLFIDGNGHQNPRVVGNVDFNDAGNGHIMWVVGLNAGQTVKVKGAIRDAFGANTGNFRVLDPCLLVEPI